MRAYKEGLVGSRIQIFGDTFGMSGVDWCKYRDCSRKGEHISTGHISTGHISTVQAYKHRAFKYRAYKYSASIHVRAHKYRASIQVQGI